jgi:hypothetical protein
MLFLPREILMRLPRPRFLSCALLFAALAAGLPGAAAPARAAQAQPPAPAQTAPGLSPEDQKRILDLKVRARSVSDPKKQLEIYETILNINPDDALAITRVEALQKQIADKTESDQKAQIEAEEEKARRQLLSDALRSGMAALVEAKRTGSSEPLTRARDALARARKYANAGDSEVDQLQAQIDQEAENQRTRRIEVWAFIGLLAAAAIGGLLLVLLRRGGALEMIAGPQPGQVFPLKQETTSIGALAGEVDWAISDPHRKISRRHCGILRSGRHFFVVDRSTNGTLLNGQPLRNGEPALLRRGDQIGLAGDVVIRFR